MGRIADLSKKDRDQIRICTVAKPRLQQSNASRTRALGLGHTKIATLSLIVSSTYNSFFFEYQESQLTLPRSDLVGAY